MIKLKYIFLLFLTTFAIAKTGKAQFGTVQFTPATFTGDDSVVFTIDLTGTPMAGQSAAYIWIWANSGSTSPAYPSVNGVVCTNWTSSPAAAQMTSLGGNKWQFGFVGSSMFGLQPGQLQFFNFLCKTQNGSSQTGNSPQYNFAPVAYVPTVYRLFPSRLGPADAISIYFYQSLSTNLTETRMTPVSATITLYDTLGNQFGQPLTLPLHNLGKQLFSASLVPTAAWTVPNPALLKQFTYVINGTSYDTNGNTVTVSGTTNTRVFDNLK